MAGERASGAGGGADGAGTMAAGPGSRRVAQVKRVRGDGWTKARRETFLAVLAQTCNVLHATRAAGMGDKAAYELRKRDPAFAALFAEAMTLGYERLEGALLSHALEGLNAIDVAALPDSALAATGPSAAMPGVARPGEVTRAGIELALTLLKHHAARAGGQGKRRVPQALPSPEETDRELLARLDLLAAKRAREAATRARAAAVPVVEAQRAIALPPPGREP